MQLPEFIQFLTTRHPEIYFISIHTMRTGVKCLAIAVTEWIEEPDLSTDIWKAQKDVGVEIKEPHLLSSHFPKETIISSGASAATSTGGRDFELLFFRD